MIKIREAAQRHALAANDVRIKVSYGGICGSDVRVYKGTISYAQYPLRPGHEVIGTVVEAGENVQLKVGTKAVVYPNTYCGECEFCAGGKTNICIHKKPLGVAVDGVFAQEVVLDAKYIMPVPEELPDERAILIEPFAVTVHALKKANITKGTTVAVIGCGTEGLLSIALALYQGADVTVVDINPVKLALASKLGNVQTRLPAEVKDEVFDVVIEAAGVKDAIQQAMAVVKPGGVMVPLGITMDTVHLSPIHIVRNEISILGSIIYTVEDFADAIAHLQDPALFVEPIISKIWACDRYQEAFDDALSGDYAKIIVKFD
ncbi:zinc-dependent alcohol dehydrogenase [Anaerospora hongkongensis]|uniref:zinc-dependent alcohol dehydrogenase n=1 Tax=Anaerospora hongkongensis TaxID=244830 RepID=UPI002FD9EF97